MLSQDKDQPNYKLYKILQFKSLKGLKHIVWDARSDFSGLMFFLYGVDMVYIDDFDIM